MFFERIKWTPSQHSAQTEQFLNSYSMETRTLAKLFKLRSDGQWDEKYIGDVDLVNYEVSNSASSASISHSLGWWRFVFGCVWCRGLQSYSLQIQSLQEHWIHQKQWYLLFIIGAHFVRCFFIPLISFSRGYSYVERQGWGWGIWGGCSEL